MFTPPPLTISLIPILTGETEPATSAAFFPESETASFHTTLSKLAVQFLIFLPYTQETHGLFLGLQNGNPNLDVSLFFLVSVEKYWPCTTDNSFIYFKFIVQYLHRSIGENYGSLRLE
jgi:hypothetical protein